MLLSTTNLVILQLTNTTQVQFDCNLFHEKDHSVLVADKALYWLIRDIVGLCRREYGKSK